MKCKSKSKNHNYAHWGYLSCFYQQHSCIQKIESRNCQNRETFSFNQDPTLRLIVQGIMKLKCNTFIWGFPGGSDGKESACNVGDLGSVPGSGRPLQEGNSNPIQYSCLEKSMDRGAWNEQQLSCFMCQVWF